jgi:type IV secretion system protein TrbL
MPTGTTLTQILDAFMQTFTLGMTRITPDALMLLRLIVTLELALLGLWITLGHLSDLSMTLVTMALKITAYVWMVTQWPTIVRTLARGFILLGLSASGNILSETQFTSPSALIDVGMAATTLVYNRIFSYSGITAIYHLPDIVLTGGAAFLAMVAFTVFAIQVFVTLLEFYALSSLVVVLLPFGFIRYVAFVAEKAIALIWAQALKLLVLSFITGVALPHLVKVSPEPTVVPTFEHLVILASTAWAIVVLAWRAPQLAQGLLAGAPQLTAETVGRAVQRTVRSVQTTVNMVRGAAA